MFELLCQQLDVLQRWYLRALELGDLCIKESNELVLKYTDERTRVLNKVVELQAKIQEIRESSEYRTLAPAQRARIDEMRMRIKDLEPRFTEQMRRLYHHFHPQLLNRRDNLVEFNRKNRAINAYMRAPGYQVAS